MEPGNSSSVSPSDILRDSAELYDVKNENYGDAWRLAPETLAMWLDRLDVDELTIQNNPDAWISLSLYLRRLEKMIRAFNGEFVVDGELEFESIADSHVDSGPYSAMHASIVMDAFGIDSIDAGAEVSDE